MFVNLMRLDIRRRHNLLRAKVERSFIYDDYHENN